MLPSQASPHPATPARALGPHTAPAPNHEPHKHPFITLIPPPSYIPPLASIFSIVPLNLAEWGLVLAFALPVILIDEVLKYLGQHPGGPLVAREGGGLLLPARALRVCGARSGPAPAVHSGERGGVRHSCSSRRRTSTDFALCLTPNTLTPSPMPPPPQPPCRPQLFWRAEDSGGCSSGARHGQRRGQAAPQAGVTNPPAPRRCRGVSNSCVAYRSVPASAGRATSCMACGHAALCELARSQARGPPARPLCPGC